MFSTLREQMLIHFSLELKRRQPERKINVIMQMESVWQFHLFIFCRTNSNLIFRGHVHKINYFSDACCTVIRGMKQQCVTIVTETL